RVLGLQEQKLSHDKGRNPVLDRPGDEDDPFLQEPRVDVVGPFATVGLFDHHGHQIVHIGIDGISHFVSLTRIMSARLALPACAMIYFPTGRRASLGRQDMAAKTWQASHGSKPWSVIWPLMQPNRHPYKAHHAKPCFR